MCRTIRDMYVVEGDVRLVMTKFNSAHVSLVLNPLFTRIFLTFEPPPKQLTELYIHTILLHPPSHFNLLISSRTLPRDLTPTATGVPSVKNPDLK